MEATEQKAEEEKQWVDVKVQVPSGKVVKVLTVRPGGDMKSVKASAGETVAIDSEVETVVIYWR